MEPLLILQTTFPGGAKPIGWADIVAILPVLVLFSSGFAALAIDLFVRPADRGPGMSRKPVLHFISLLGTVVAGAILCAQLVDGGPVPVSYFSEALIVDRFSLVMALLITAGTAFSLLGAVDALRRRGLEHGEFHCLVLLAAGAMILFTQSASLIMAFLSLETLSMAVYVLTAFHRDDKRAVEGSLKYFILGGLSTGFLLLGLAFIYGATRSTNLVEIASIISIGADAPLFAAGMGLTLIGLAFKIGAFPFHSWVPDAYEGAMSVVAGFMAVTVKVASFAVLLRIATLPVNVPAQAGLPGIRQEVVTVLSALAVLTMIFGNLVAVVQTSVKRMLAYSAIAHTGYLLVGVVAAAEGKPLSGGAGSGAAVIFYLFPYALMSLGAFTCLSHLGDGAGDRESLEDFRGLSRTRPVLSLGILLLMASFVGIPPTSGFWGKFYIFRQALESGHWGLALTGIVTSAISAYYYLGLVVAMYMQPPTGASPSAPAEGRSWGELAIALAVAVVVLVGFFPDVFFRLSVEYALR